MAQALTTSKIAEVMLEKAKDSYEAQMQMLPLVTREEPEAGSMQNAGNVIWRPRQQHAPIISGWDLTGQETGIIEETYPAVLGTPSNDFVEQRADDMRTKTFWERRGKQSGLRQASELNKLLATAVSTQGSLFYRSNVTSGYEFVAPAQAVMNERQQVNNGRTFMINDRDNLTYGGDLAGRQTLQGRPETVWSTGQIGQNIAGFDLFTASFLPNLAGGANPATTVTGNQTFAPEAGSVVSATGVVTNVDCRIATIPVAASGSYNVGDKVTIGAVKALGLADKTDTGQLMTFSIVGKPTATSIQIYPKPIAADDAALSTLEKAYANVDTTIKNTNTVDRLNIDASAKSNIFFDKESVEVLGGNIPAELFSQFDGMKVITDTLSNGLTMYMVYDGNMATMTFRYRLFVWYGITVCAPESCGTAVAY